MVRSTVRISAWTGSAVLLALIIMFAGGAGVVAQAVAAMSILVLTFHAVLAVGCMEAAVFATICLATTFAVENLGVVTGFPFGRYAFLVGAGCRISASSRSSWVRSTLGWAMRPGSSRTYWWGRR